MRPTRAALAATLLGLVAGAGAMATPAAAAAGTCALTRTVCVWENADTSGARFTVQAGNPATGTCVDLAAHAWGAGRAKTARNTGTQPATLYTGTDCTGQTYRIAPGGTYSVSFGSNSIYVY